MIFGEVELCHHLEPMSKTRISKSFLVLIILNKTQAYHRTSVMKNLRDASYLESQKGNKKKIGMICILLTNLAKILISFLTRFLFMVF